MRLSSVREGPAVEAYGRSNRGSRADNQDAILVEPPWFAVSDGVGGHSGGAAAAAAAMAAVREFVSQRPSATSVVDAVLHAHAAVQALAAAVLDERRRPATTLTVAGLTIDRGTRTVEIAHVGDSRAYVISEGAIRQVTTDHSLVEELVRGGHLEAEEARRHPMRNVVTRVCGQQGPLTVDHCSVQVQAGDFVLLVSDGVPAHLSEADMHFVVDNSRHLRDVPSTVEWAAGALVAHALGRGGSDNASAVLVRIP